MFYLHGLTADGILADVSQAPDIPEMEVNNITKRLRHTSHIDGP